jgi:hypothetical protein
MDGVLVQEESAAGQLLLVGKQVSVEEFNE